MLKREPRYPNRTLAISPTPRYNWRPDKSDSRDYIFEKLNTIPATLPPSVDLRSHCPPIVDQGQVGSCTGCAIAGIIGYYDNTHNKSGIVVSRLFIYYQERLLEGTIYYDAGAYIRDGIKACNQWGAPLETLWPYLANKVTTRPSTGAYTDAAKRKAGTFKKLLHKRQVLKPH